MTLPIRKYQLNAFSISLEFPTSLGKAFHKKMIDRLEKQKSLSVHAKRYPLMSFKEKFHQELVESRRTRGSPKIPESHFREQLEKDLGMIAESMKVGNKEQPSVMDRMEAVAIDCYLYAPDKPFRSSKTDKNSIIPLRKDG